MMLNWNDYPNFTEDEFMCKCGCDRADMDKEFMRKLQALRFMLAFPFIVTSGFRCEIYDLSIGGKGAHPTGQAVDLNVWGERVNRIVAQAPVFGFDRIGAKQKGDKNKRFIHLDNIKFPKFPSPWFWTY